MFCKNCGNEISSNKKFCTSCGFAVPVDNRLIVKLKMFFKKNRHTLTTLIALVVLVAIVIVMSSNGSTRGTSEKSESFVNNTQNKIAASVVNILCPDREGGVGGSGTIVDPKGFVLTNAHIIPQDLDGNPTATECLVTLPDPISGNTEEIYLGTPILFPGISKQYDLAFIRIDNVFSDEKGKSYGKYPNTFPSFFLNGCENNNPKLGEVVRVYGYPAISAGGYSLTITDGTVSSLPSNGNIYTSAKISHGNSGGLAVDENGCMIGIPSEVSSDENESLGIIYPNSAVLEFLDKMPNN